MRKHFGHADKEQSGGDFQLHGNYNSTNNFIHKQIFVIISLIHSTIINKLNHCKH